VPGEEMRKLIFILLIGLMSGVAWAEKTKSLTAEEYCSIENGCPEDKCDADIGCAQQLFGGGGCVPELQGCSIKDPGLSLDYIQITREQAQECVYAYIDSQRTEHPEFKLVNKKAGYADPAEKVEHCIYLLCSPEMKEKLFENNSYFYSVTLEWLDIRDISDLDLENKLGLSDTDSLDVKSKVWNFSGSNSVFVVGAQKCDVYPAHGL
jgi:hypothetical protein